MENETVSDETTAVVLTETEEEKVRSGLEGTQPDAKGTRSPIKVDSHGLAFASAAEVFRVADGFVKSGVAPVGMNAGAVMASILRGAALGLDPITSLSKIRVIKGSTMMGGDLILGLILRSGACENYSYGWEGEGNTRSAWIKSKRRNGPTITHTFSMADASRAGLLNKKGSAWTNWTDDMLLWRAVSRMGRRQYPDVCAGVYVPGEVPEAGTGEDFDSTPPPAAVTAPAGPDPVLAAECDANNKAGVYVSTLPEPDFTKPPSAQPEPPDPIETKEEPPKKGKKTGRLF